MYRGPRPHRGSYPPAASRGFGPRGPPPVNSFTSAQYRNEHARGTGGYQHGYRRHSEHPRRRCSSPGRGSAEDFRGDGPSSRDYGHRYTASPQHGGLPTDRSLVITVGNKFTGLSQSAGAEIPYARDYSSHQSSYEGHDEHSSRRHSHCRNRDWSHSPDGIRSRNRQRSRSSSPAATCSRTLSRGGSKHRSRSRTQSRGRSRARSRTRSNSRQRSRNRSRGRSRSCSGSSRNSKRDQEDFGELERAHRRKELEDMMMMPTKSILKKRADSSETDFSMIGQKDLTTAGQYANFPMSKQPKDDHSAFISPSEPSDTAFKKPCNPPSVLHNTVDFFDKLIYKASLHTSNNKAVGQQSFQPRSGFYDQKSTRETKDQRYSTLPSQMSQFSHQDCDQTSTSEGSSAQSSASKQKSNLATQMDRFLGALNKADSNLLSSLLRGARKDSDPLENWRILQDQGDYPLNRSKPNMKPILGQIENTQDDLLPHEIAVVDGSGFSKNVGMKYNFEAKSENRFLYGEAITTSSESRLLEEREQFLKECDEFKVSQDHYRDEPYVEDSYAENREKYERQKPCESYRAVGRLSPVCQKSEDTNEDMDQNASHYKSIQELLQTIGLELDTTEVSKLADRTKERLYGKKVKTQTSHSFDQKDEKSTRRYDRRDSSHSTDSEGVSPVKTSNREVYMSYLDFIKHHRNEGTVEERDLFNLKRTVKNSPEAKQMTSDPNKIVTHDSYKPTAEAFSLAQSVGLQCTQMSSEFSTAANLLKSKQDSWECSYATDGKQNPCGSVSLNPLHYATGYRTPPSHLLSGYASYTASARPSSMMLPSPAQFYPALSTFTAPGSFGPFPTFPYTPTSGQFGSGYATQQTKAKPTTHNRCLKTIETVQTEKSVGVKPFAAKEVHTFISKPAETESKDTEAESQVAPMMEDDIKAKQKKRLEQFNQRMKLKKEQQMEAQRTEGLSQKSAPGKVMQTEVKNVWICGHSLVFWAEKRATSPEIGMQLGMDPNSVRIWWKGVQGMMWQQLLPQLLQLKDNWPKPDVILIHLGGNDIGKMTPEDFVLAVKKDMISLKSIFPQCCLVWSDILARKSWRHSNDSTTVNNMRQAINKTIHGIMAELGSSSLTHNNIFPRLDSGLYRPDGVHLSGKGIDTFNLNMQDFLEKWESEISEMETSES